MIRHVVVFTWLAEATDEQKRHASDQVATLPSQMTGLRAYHFGPDAGLVSGSADFAIVADFDSADDYEAYRTHPAHIAVIERAIRPITLQRLAAQFEIPA
jgi:stress responsive alpha/beta barrel protein